MTKRGCNKHTVIIVLIVVLAILIFSAFSESGYLTSFKMIPILFSAMAGGASSCEDVGGTCHEGTCPEGYEEVKGLTPSCNVVGGSSDDDDGSFCGNGVCDSDEGCSSCATDCGCESGYNCINNECREPRCGDGIINLNEECETNSHCDLVETCQDCICTSSSTPPVCPSGTCEEGENCDSCPDDCLDELAGEICCGIELVTPECNVGTCPSGETCDSPGTCNAYCRPTEGGESGCSPFILKKDCPIEGLGLAILSTQNHDNVCCVLIETEDEGMPSGMNINLGIKDIGVLSEGYNKTESAEEKWIIEFKFSRLKNGITTYNKHRIQFVNIKENSVEVAIASELITKELFIGENLIDIDKDGIPDINMIINSIDAINKRVDFSIELYPQPEVEAQIQSDYKEPKGAVTKIGEGEALLYKYVLSTAIVIVCVLIIILLTKDYISQKNPKKVTRKVVKIKKIKNARSKKVNKRGKR